MYSQPCYYTSPADNEYIFKRFGNTVYAFAFYGTGFKHAPVHAKRIHDLITGGTATKKYDVAKL